MPSITYFTVKLKGALTCAYLPMRDIMPLLALLHFLLFLINVHIFAIRA